MDKFMAPKKSSAPSPAAVPAAADEHQEAVCSISDNIAEVEIKTDSARRVKELVEKFGREYADGELNHGERGKVLTGSEIPSALFSLHTLFNNITDLIKKAICGENRFETPSAAFFKKAFDVRFKGNDATEHGKKYEPIAIAKYKKMSGAKIFFVRFMLHSEYKFLGGTFDGVAILPSGEGVLIEIKCPYTRSVGSVIPEHYVGQVQVYLEIANLDRCLFIQYKPSYITPGRGFHRPEKLTVIPVMRDPGYFVTRMPILWKFYKRLCAFREGVMPTAPAAASVIQNMWRRKHRKSVEGRAVTDLRVRLLVTEFSRQRKMYEGVREAVEAEMEFVQRPRMPTRALASNIKLVVVADTSAAPQMINPASVASSSNSHLQTLVVCESSAAPGEALKRPAPDFPADNDDEDNPEKKIR